MASVSTTTGSPASGRLQQDFRDHPWSCHARLWSGIVLFAFVLTHLLNHALGIFGVEAMEVAQQWRWLLWKSLPGSVLLYACFLTHMILSSLRILRRHTWRMPRDEAWQIVSGLAIPLLAAGHVLETRVGGTWFGADEAYHAVLARMWPAVATWQTVLLLVAWTHGVVGIHHSLRYQNWYPHWRTTLRMVAIIVPLLALAGFVASGREAAARYVSPKPMTEEQRAGLDRARMMLDSGLGAFGIGLAGLIGFAYVRRRSRATVTITYRGHGPVQVPRGISVLEASRMHGIPHPSTCRGRGRCSTCRVHIIAGAKGLPDASGPERLLLSHIGAPENVRLGCQLRPTHDIGVRVLMPVLGRPNADVDGEANEWALERNATVLCLDLRAFSTLTQNRLPYEIAVLINRFAAEMTQAVESHGGHIDLMYGDGLLAVFDVDDHHVGAGARAALSAARDMSKVLDLLNSEMRGALPIPIRAGIGIHTGPVVLARIGDGLQNSVMRAIGSTVAFSVGLEAASKEFLADYVIAVSTAEASGYDFTDHSVRDVVVDAHNTTVPAYAVSDRAALDKIMARPAMLRVLNKAGV
ncbi:adenylate/guanylate cyclase domain-containing protein [Ancylobacter sonchi]